ncbi:NAD(P)-binding protein [Venustampulla echinocandica]|uniref:NAD(P)-binding protein n=1 Tax=Venustampulla echinocandica TaxID=2656787 RepID=A0A370TCK9_9HELO|nr:NAD(P)-binding protein [Venustampulla echinocandica]RDL31965.1 NAD(P)-binding protein [Venustampulla echinocandica]
MASNTVYIITGANRGIGLGLTASLLLRPNVTVIATVRSASTGTSDLKNLPLAEGSGLIIALLDVSTTSSEEITKSANTLYETLKDEHRIEHVDILIANAGVGFSFNDVMETSLDSILAHVHANTLGPIALYQALRPLLLSAVEKGRSAKFLLISSSLGAIGQMEGNAPSLAYGLSKAAANYLVRKVHFEEKGITTLAIHPGWVQTDNGQKFADSVGVAQPPMTTDDSVKGILAQIDLATKTTTSGTFVTWDGKPMAW